MLNNKILILVVASFCAVLIGLFILSWMMKQPLYKFGDVAIRKNLRGPLVPPAQTDENTWQVEADISLKFTVAGEGRPVLIVHGGPAIPYRTTWMGMDRLTARRKFFYYHQRGCGDSTKPFDRFDGSFYSNMIQLEQTLGLGAQIADIERIRQILNQEKITLVGHSFGGFITAMYAAEFPDRVDQLVLCAPAGVLTPPGEDRNLFSLARAKLAPVEHASYDQAVQEYLDFGKVFSKSESEILECHARVGAYLMEAMGYEQSLAIQGAGGWAAVAMYFSIGRAQNYRPALAKIRAETLIILGADDEIAKAGSETYQEIPNSRFVTVERDEVGMHAGHFVYDESPRGFGDVIAKFLRD